MKRREMMIALALMGAAPSMRAGPVGATPDARVLPYRYPESPALKQFAIDVPGRYLLNEDHIQRARFAVDGGNMSVKRGYMVHINCGSVELDLQGHLIGADARMSGISLFVAMNKELARRFPQKFSAGSLDNRFVTVRNGAIDLARGTDTGGGMSFSDQWHAHNLLTAGRPRDLQGNVLDMVDYPRNDYRFEDLRILANDVALSVEGSHTVIRHCVIESADKAAIFIAGDNVVIENCEIRLRKSWRGRIGQPRAAIVLRDGANAIIRDNRIRVDHDEKGQDELHCILVRDGAQNVLIEGNTFIGVKGDPVTLTEGAGATVRHNMNAQPSLWS